MNNKTGLIFDLDGTLVDSMNFLGEVACEVLNQIYGLNSHDALKAYKTTSGKPFEYQIENIYPADSRNGRAVELFNKLKESKYFESSFFKEVPDVLASLKESGFKLFVSSNSYHELVIRKTGELKINFDAVFGMKPGFLKGRAHFSKIMEGYPCEHYLFFGDSIHDARVAFENKIPFYARLGTNAEKDFEALSGVIGMAYHFNNLSSFLKQDFSSFKSDETLKNRSYPLKSDELRAHS
ncbi:MAG: Glucose-1-phosphate thymidylyl transferase [uncultured bacterium]|nr:MAG: Glucose-1-phosphate thymidylyl transferase [uncultured bacterium]